MDDTYDGHEWGRRVMCHMLKRPEMDYDFDCKARIYELEEAIDLVLAWDEKGETTWEAEKDLDLICTKLRKARYRE